MEHLIIKGTTHTLVDSTRNEAVSFSEYGDMVCKVDAVAVKNLSYGNIKDVALLSFVSTGYLSALDIMFKDHHCMIQLDKPMVKFISEIKGKLPLVSIVPYRVKHDSARVVHTIFALNASTSLECVSKLVNVPKELWESMPEVK